MRLPERFFRHRHAHAVPASSISSTTRAAAERPAPGLPLMTMTFRSPRSRMLPLAASLLLAACAPLHVAPPDPVTPPAAFKEAPPPAAAASAPAQAASSVNVGGTTFKQARPDPGVPTPDAWWTLFKDPVLDDLESRLAVGNEDIKSALAQVESARATLDAANRAFFPTLSVGLNGTRSKPSSGNAQVVARGIRDSYSLTANASWEADVWGRLSQAASAAGNTFQATQDDLAAARLSAQALLAQTYFSMRAAEAQRALYERTVTAYERSLELTKARYESGVIGTTDVLQAQTTLRNAQASLAEATASRQQLEHAIAVLLGIPPSSLQIDPIDKLPDPVAIPTLLPSTLLERRPDINAAQRRVLAAYQQIGIANAAYYPSLTLSASSGYTSAALSNLVNVPNLAWSLGLSIAQSIFDNGARQLASAQARASAEVAASTYRKTVLTAFQEVEDNLVLAEQLQQEVQLQTDALDAARRNLGIVQDQYRAGTVSFLDVTTAQASVLSTENSLLTVRNRQLAAANTLLKNIAGRW